MRFFPSFNTFIEIGPLSIQWYAVCILTGAAIAYFLGQYHFKKLGYSKEILSDYCHEMDINKIVVIPSSIHEMLFLPWDEKIDERYMDEMIQGVNDILVSPVEQLGNKSYIMEV